MEAMEPPTISTVHQFLVTVKKAITKLKVNSMPMPPIREQNRPIKIEVDHADLDQTCCVFTVIISKA